jgi:hypothetical protein
MSFAFKGLHPQLPFHFFLMHSAVQIQHCCHLSSSHFQTDWEGATLIAPGQIARSQLIRRHHDYSVCNHRSTDTNGSLTCQAFTNISVFSAQSRLLRPPFQLAMSFNSRHRTSSFKSESSLSWQHLIYCGVYSVILT